MAKRVSAPPYRLRPSANRVVVAPQARPRRRGRLLLLLLANLALYVLIGGLVQNPSFDAGGADVGGPVVMGLAFVLPTPEEEPTIVFGGFPTPTPEATATRAPLAEAPAATAPVKVQPTPTQTIPAFRPEDLATLNLPDTLNIIIMGSDRRPGWRTWRTDALMLASIHQKTNSVSVISIPRDLWVRIPSYGYERINAADVFGELYHYPGGGPNLLKQTIRDNLGIRVHYYMRVDFNSFIQAVDSLGGIDVDVDCRIDLWDVWGGLVIDSGLQHMDGQTALYFSRGRLTTNDIDRSRRQRKVLLAIWEKARQLNYLSRWPELWGQFRDGVQTDLGLKEMAALALFGARLTNERIKMSALDFAVVHPTTMPSGEQVLVGDPGRVNSALSQAMAPPDANAEARAKEQAVLDVSSSDGSAQTAELVMTTLRRQGYNTRQARVAAEPSRQTQLVVWTDKPATVKQLVQQFQIAAGDVRYRTNKPADAADLELVLAKDYRTCGR